MKPADPRSDASGKKRAGLSSEAPGPAGIVMRPAGTPAKVKRAGVKHPAAAIVKHSAAAVKRLTAIPEEAASNIATTLETTPPATAEPEDVAQPTEAGTEPAHDAAGTEVEVDAVENEITAGHEPAEATAPVAEAAVEPEIVAESEPSLPENGTAAAHAEAAASGHAATAPSSRTQAGAAQPKIISAYTGSSLARAPEPPRFNIFIIDTGWNSVATRILNENLPLIRELNPSDGTFFLDRDRSISVLRRHHALIGRDPIISVHDLDVMNKGVDGGSPSGVHGFRLHLGLVKTEEKIKDALEMFLRFLRRHRDSRHLEKDVRQKLRKEGIAGTIEIMGHGVELFRG